MNNKTIRLAATLAMVFVLAGCTSTPQFVCYMPPSPALDFLAGHWTSVHGANQDLHVTEEYWLPFRPDGSIGVNRTTIGGQTAAHEFLRIETSAGETVYIAHPNGRSPGTRFTMTEHSDNRVVFENPDHDFPQRIIYQRDGDTLHVRIEGTQNGQPRSQSWTFHRRH